MTFGSCEPTHSLAGGSGLIYSHSDQGSRAISNKKAFSGDDCVILSSEAFDPDAVFLEDIVDDEVLPYLSLAVDGLTEAKEGKTGKLEIRPEDMVANEEPKPDTTMPVATLDSDQFVEVYGWETSWWKKVKGYFGF
jgi:hypothetical protein